MIRPSTSGPHSAKIALVGEAWGQQEELARQPFMGAAGNLLNSILRNTGLSRSDCFVTNVFHERPPSNDVLHFFTDKKNGCTEFPPLRPGKYLKPAYRNVISDLKEELKAVKPNIIISLGATATWALIGQGKISNHRGVIVETELGKILPTFHPAAVLRQFEYYPVVLADFIKAKREAEYPELRRPKRKVLLAESVHDIDNFFTDEILLKSTTSLAFDIETARGQITCIGFAPREDIALVVPFVNPDFTDYWPDTETERRAWHTVAVILDQPQIAKVGHNGLYDIQYLWRVMGIPVRNYLHDTMLLHHALQPEMQKSLGFLGSIYTNEIAWKEIRKHAEDKPED